MMASKARSTQSIPKNATMGLSELNRIKALAAETKTMSTIEEDRQKLKQISENRTKNWPNTINALRTKKEHDKFEKFEREEIERRKIDEEEARYQGAIKGELIDRAKRQIFERHDKVKTLHSKMLLSDALQERELQKEIERQKAEIQKEAAKEYHELILEQCQDFDKKAEVKKKEVEEKKRVTQQILKHQHELFKDKHIVRLMEEKLEGEIIKEKAKEQEAKALQDEANRRTKIKMAQEETRKGNELLQEIRAKEREKEQLEDLKIEKYSKEKEETRKRRKAEADQKFAEKQRIRQQMIDRALEDLKNKNNKESERLNRDIEEARMKAENTEKEKKERIEKLKATIDHHRELYMRDKNIAEVTGKEEDRNFVQFWKEKNNEKQIVEDKNHRRLMNKKLAEYQKIQADERALGREKQLMKEMEEAEQIRKALENDDKMINTYAKRCLDEWSSQGKNVTPLLLELKKQKMQNLENM